METPPPYSSPAKKSNTKLIIILVIAGISVCCVLPIVGLVVGTGWVLKNGSGLITCMIAYQQVPKAIEQYTASNDGKLPDAKKWNDQVRPFYLKVTKNRTSAGPFKFMDGNGEWGCDESPKTGMVFNSELSGKKMSEIADKSTVMLFESTKTGKNLNEPYKPLPFEKSPTAMGTKEHRGWIIVTVNGDTFLVDEKGDRVKSQSTTSF